MSIETFESHAPSEALELLDALIVRFYNRIIELDDQGKLIVRPGDFMKMIELRNKLAPSKSEQQEFWAHIDKIRKEVLNQEPVKKDVRTNTKSKNKSSTSIDA